jgi:hypothetical protein
MRLKAWFIRIFYPNKICEYWVEDGKWHHYIVVTSYWIKNSNLHTHNT